jgi:phosphoglycolate phosphatase
LYRLAIFDFDGTLVDSAPGIVDVMRQVVDEYMLSKEIFEQWRQLIGVPLLTQVEMIFPDAEGKFHEEVANRYRTIYDTKVIEICPPFPALKKTLHELAEAEIDIAIVTSKRRGLVEVVLDHHNISTYFKLVLGQQDVSNHKPHPEPVHFTLSKLNHMHPHAVVIGDSTFDLDMARAAGVDSIGVTTGIHTRQILEGSQPVKIVDKLEEVLPIILNGRHKVV